MPFLKSLEISGFRSYSSDEPQFVKFKSPLTLILGKNGSGKTTILEVLRFCCSGQFPPNSGHGKTFLRDPFLDNIKNTQAQTQLVFQSVYDTQIIATRKAKLSRVKNDQYKNMGQSLQTRNEQNELVNIDQNLAQFDRTIPFLLGSNKEILESVILCHQEDQFWMFQDPNSLKKIFDSIFNSTHISKFIEISQKQAKLKQKQNIQDSHEAKFSRLEYEQFMAQKKDLIYQIDKLSLVKQKIQELQELILTHTDYQKINQIERQIGDINSKIQQNTEKKQDIKKQIEELRIDENTQLDEQAIKQEIQHKNNQRNQMKETIERIRHKQENMGLLLLQDQINTILLKLKFNIIQDQEFCDVQLLLEKQEQLKISKEKQQENLQEISKEYQEIVQNKEEIIKTFTIKLDDLQKKQEDYRNIEKQRQAYQYQQRLFDQEKIRTELMKEEEISLEKLEQYKIDRAKMADYIKILQNTSLLQQIKEKRKNIQKICKEYKWCIDNKGDIQIVLKNLNCNIEELQKSHQNKAVELDIIRQSILQKQKDQNEIIQQRDNMTKLLKDNKLEISIDSDAIEEYMKLKQKIKNIQEDTVCIEENIRYTKSLYDKSIQLKHCQLCLQQIEDDQTLVVDLSHQQKISEFNSLLKQTQKELNELLDIYNSQKELKDKLKNFQKCFQKLQKISNDVQEAIIRKKEIDKEIKVIQHEQSKLRDQINILRSIEIQFYDLEQYEKQINFDENQVQNSNNKNYEQIQQEINELYQTINQYEKSIEQTKQQINNVQRNIKQIRNRCMALQDEIISLGFSVKQEIENPEDKVKEDYNTQIQHTQIAIVNQKSHYQKKIEEIDDKRISIKVLVSFYDDCLQKIQEYITKNDEDNSLQTKNEIYAQIEQLTSELIKLSKKNQLIQLKKAKEKNIIELEQLKRTLQNFLDKKQVLSKGKKEYEELKEQISEQYGQEKVFKQQIQTLIIKLRDQANKQLDGSNIVFKTIKHSVRNEINQHIVKDLIYLNKNLEQACISVNKEQINTINKVIQNIWRETYSSTDIQTIKIKSQPKKNNKTEVEYKIFALDSEGKQMDFKSKSSAGQKMLASIVIRLALAELYSQQCGIFALDEPTTNLDANNIVLLANFLKRLVDMKKTDEDFQLIIITHDEKFLRQMHGLIDSYFELSMGISRDSRHKRRLTGGRMPIHQKKRVYESGRPMAHTKLGEKRIKKLRVRGGNYKFRALRLNTGNYNWQSEGVTLKTKILNVVYNASNNELVRTNTLVKNTVVRVDATPFKNYVLKRYYGTDEKELESQTLDMTKWEQTEETKDKRVQKYQKRRKNNKLDTKLVEQLQKGIVLACISSRPGQSGRADGYLLEGKELEFYMKKLEKK